MGADADMDMRDEEADEHGYLEQKINFVETTIGGLVKIIIREGLHEDERSKHEGFPPGRAWSANENARRFGVGQKNTAVFLARQALWL